MVPAGMLATVARPCCTLQPAGFGRQWCVALAAMLS
jgi:hypothetical protein